jgi:hypothetical protein
MNPQPGWKPGSEAGRIEGRDTILYTQSTLQPYKTSELFQAVAVVFGPTLAGPFGKDVLQRTLEICFQTNS